MTRPPTLLEQLAVGMAAAAVTRGVLAAVDRRRRPLDVEHCGGCFEVDRALSTPGQPSHVCRRTLATPEPGGCR